MEPGEDRHLRQQLRQLDGRRAAAERCRLVSVGLGGGGGGEGGGIAHALRDVQLQVKQLLSQEERLAAQAAAEREEEEAAAAAKRGGARSAAAAVQAGERSGEDEAAGSSGGEPAEEEGEEEADGGSAAGMLHAAVSLLDEAQALLDEAEERVVQYARRYRFSQAEYDQLSKRLQQVGGGWRRACGYTAGRAIPRCSGAIDKRDAICMLRLVDSMAASHLRWAGLASRSPSG